MGWCFHSAHLEKFSTAYGKLIVYTNVFMVSFSPIALHSMQRFHKVVGKKAPEQPAIYLSRPGVPYVCMLSQINIFYFPL